jgi:hypothetical protein
MKGNIDLATWRTDSLGSTTIAVHPATAVRDGFHEIPEVEQVYLETAEDRSLSALIVIDKKDFAAMRRIFQVETKLIEALAGTSINFDVVIRDGHPVGDIVSPRGKLLFQR